MVENIEKLIGKKVKEARDRAKLTQTELADLAKTSLTTINRLENGKQFPHSDTLRDIANVLGISYSELFGNEQERESQGDRAQLILEVQTLLNKLNFDDLETMKTAAEGLLTLSMSKNQKSASNE